MNWDEISNSVDCPLDHILLPSGRSFFVQLIGEVRQSEKASPLAEPGGLGLSPPPSWKKSEGLKVCLAPDDPKNVPYPNQNAFSYVWQDQLIWRGNINKEGEMLKKFAPVQHL